jgi:hypothetical protein
VAQLRELESVESSEGVSRVIGTRVLVACSSFEATTVGTVCSSYSKVARLRTSITGVVIIVLYSGALTLLLYSICPLFTGSSVKIPFFPSTSLHTACRHIYIPEYNINLNPFTK